MPLWDRERKRSLKTMNEQDHAKLKLAFEYYRAWPDGTTWEDQARPV
jgi:hypothetical protein